MIWNIQTGISRKRVDWDSFSNCMKDHAAQVRKKLIMPAENLENAFMVRFQKGDDKLENTSMQICLLCFTAIEAPRNPSQRTH